MIAAQLIKRRVIMNDLFSPINETALNKKAWLDHINKLKQNSAFLAVNDRTRASALRDKISGSYQILGLYCFGLLLTFCVSMMKYSKISKTLSLQSRPGNFVQLTRSEVGFGQIYLGLVIEDISANS